MRDFKEKRKSHESNKKYKILAYAIILILVMLLLSTFYSPNKADSVPQQVLEDNDPITRKVLVSADYAVATKVEGLVRLANTIVVGHYEKFIEAMDLGDKYYGKRSERPPAVQSQKRCRMSG